MAIKYGANGKIIAKKFTLEQIMSASDDMNGFCLACGYEQGCCEPDARKYKCESCGKNLVYGAEELTLMGYVT